ncbi:hypothetical protein DSLASN_12510 [Desulfoluna limicola]|uniref:Uncharacterized protein n=1 Tax=Desulfoluna limicola TaxID=2810562 RepID=A0ABM7PD95_9BACT|nr:hypothetical protein DSLASN_12510 [Desulfoluna limicola]
MAKGGGRLRQTGILNGGLLIKVGWAKRSVPIKCIFIVLKLPFLKIYALPVSKHGPVSQTL